MKRNPRSRLVGVLAVSLLGMAALPSAVWAQGAVAAGGEVKITVTTAAAPPPVSFTLHERHGHITPHKGHLAHTGGGLIEVVSPSPDVVIITMSGAVVATADMKFDLEQCFEVNFDDPKVKKARLSLEGRVIGLLRSHPKGSAEYTEACAHINAGPINIMSIAVPPHSVSDCDSLAVNDHDGPKGMPVTPDKYTLQQTFSISAHSDCCLFKRPSAEFAPDPALDPLWISYWDPFHGVKKDTFGFQVVLKVAPDEGSGNKEAPEKLPPPTKP